MVGFVIVSHSKTLAEGVVELSKMMASDAKIVAAGGLEDGSFGTSYQLIKEAITAVYSEDGVLILVDMGSAVMTTEMVIEDFDDEKIKTVDCPIVEGAIVGTVNATIGMAKEDIRKELENVGVYKKI